MRPKSGTRRAVAVPLTLAGLHVGDRVKVRVHRAGHGVETPWAVVEEVGDPLGDVATARVRLASVLCLRPRPTFDDVLACHIRDGMLDFDVTRDRGRPGGYHGCALTHAGRMTPVRWAALVDAAREALGAQLEDIGDGQVVGAVPVDRDAVELVEALNGAGTGLLFELVE